MFLVAAAFAFPGCSPASQPEEPTSEAEQPYAGLQERDIAALPAERIAELLAGEGAGYALAAELNHYPGPKHVLGLADDLGLTTLQHERVSAVRLDMQAKAKALGRRLVVLERRLNSAFRSEEITSDELGAAVAEIAKVEGRLRATHLEAHLETKAILSARQVGHYDMLRGYAGKASAGHEHGSQEDH